MPEVKNKRTCWNGYMSIPSLTGKISWNSIGLNRCISTVIRWNKKITVRSERKQTVASSIGPCVSTATGCETHKLQTLRRTSNMNQASWFFPRRDAHCTESEGTADTLVLGRGVSQLGCGPTCRPSHIDTSGINQTVTAASVWTPEFGTQTHIQATQTLSTSDNHHSSFCATVCKTVRPMLSVRCLSVLYVQSVCNVGVLWPKGWMDKDETACR